MRKLKEAIGAVPVVTTIVDVSKQLQQAIKTADRESAVSAARAAVFESANAPREQTMPAPALRIIETHFDTVEGIEAEHQLLERALDSSGVQPGHQVHELERAEAYARRSFKLFVKFKQLAFEWEQDNRVMFASMRTEANKTLQHEKTQGYRNKQITDADVDTMCSSMFPDEWRAQESRRNKVKLTEKSLEHLVEMWSIKCRSLNALVAKGR